MNDGQSKNVQVYVVAGLLFIAVLAFWFWYEARREHQAEAGSNFFVELFQERGESLRQPLERAGESAEELFGANSVSTTTSDEEDTSSTMRDTNGAL